MLMEKGLGPFRGGGGVGWRKKPGKKFFVDIVAPFLA